MRIVFLVLALSAVSGCSLIVERRAVQCTTDADCSTFGPHPFCIQNVCVESGLGPAGCFYGTPATDLQYLNQCSTGCLAFDNCARLGLCSPSAELPPLIPRP